MEATGQRLKALLDKGKKYQYAALVLILGLVLLLVPFGRAYGDSGTAAEDERETPAAVTQSESASFSLSTFTGELETLLSALDGAGQVRVLLTLDGDTSYVFQQDTARSEDDGANETQEETVLAQSGASAQTPIAVSSVYPTFRGAVVLCEGAGTPEVRYAIKQAVSNLTGLGLDKITVLRLNAATAP